MKYLNLIKTDLNIMAERWRVTVHTHRSDTSVDEPELVELNRNNNYLNMMTIGDSMLRLLPLMGAMSTAISGATIQELGRRYQTNFYKGAYDPDVIVLMIGTNNIEDHYDNITEHIEHLFKNLAETFTRQLKIVIGIRHRPKDTNWNINVTNERTERRKRLE